MKFKRIIACILVICLLMPNVLAEEKRSLRVNRLSVMAQSFFDENGFRYWDHVEGRPMAIEVPADQYEAALEYMRNRIANGELQYKTSLQT